MMRTYTNMTWPDDPYRTGQQLYRRPVPRLAAFTAGRTAVGGNLVSSAVAIVYLPLHRTQAMSVTEQTLTFGFRAASADDPADLPALAVVADLDLMQARRHAAVLAGRLLASDLAALQAGNAAVRGLAAVEREWAARGKAAGQAATFDCGLDLPGTPSLELACQQAGIAAGSGADEADGAQAVTLAVERALMIALVCARHQGRYEWAGVLRIGPVLAAATWDCLPQPATDSAALPSQTAAQSGIRVAAALPGNLN
ncbi:MAG TPA: hypothetical protein VH637_12265 [Streptosporangiaceae bacterium]|jgi:hypothetical protein